MNAWMTFLNDSAVQSLIFALGHTLWQGLVVAGLAYTGLRLIPARHANIRYLLCLGPTGS